MDSNTVVELNDREKLIEHILSLPNDKIVAIARFVYDLDDDFNPEEIEELKQETGGIALEDYMAKNGITAAELDEIARVEKWIP